jgi:hypothetical protein
MHLSVAHLLLGLGILAIVALLVWLSWILRHKELYTREKFSFVALASLCALATTIMATLSHKETPWGALMNLIREASGLPEQPDPPRLADHFLMVVVLGIVCAFILRMHQQWAGAMSARQFEKKKYHEPSPLYVEAIEEARRMLKRQPQQIYAQDDSQRFVSVLEPTGEPLAWHIQARDLLCLRSPSFEIDRINGWHEAMRSWIGFNKKSEQLIAIRCDLTEGTNAELEEFVSYVLKRGQQRNITGDAIEFILAVKHAVTIEPLIVAGYKIQKETENTLLNELVDFSDYFADIKFRAEQQNLPDSALNFTQVYTPCSCKTENGVVHPNLEKYVKDWLLEQSQKQIALLGEYGQGKSTTALMTTYHLIKENLPEQRVPILIELRGKSPRNMTPEEIVAAWAFPYRINPQAVLKLLIAGRIFLILEGFDEMALIGDSEARLAHFRTLWKFCYPLSKIMITGRPNFFLDDGEMKAALGISKSIAAGPYCEAAQLEPFSITQIEDALRAVAPQTRAEIVALARADEKFKEIVSRGSLLYVVSQLWEREQLSKYAGRITSAFVMELFIQHSYRRQTVKSADSPEFMVLNEGERKYFMSGVAAYMGALDLPNQIDREHFMRAVKALYELIPVSVSVQQGVVQNSLFKALKERMRDVEDPIQDVANDVRSSGILVTDQSKSGALKFAHKSFMEFLIAEVYAGYISRTNRETSSAIIAASRLRIPHLIRHEESLLFFAELFLGALDQNAPPHTLAQQLFSLVVVQPLGGGFLARMKALLAIQSMAARGQIRRREGLFFFRLLKAMISAPEMGVPMLLMTGIYLLVFLKRHSMLARSHGGLTLITLSLPIILALSLWLVRVCGPFSETSSAVRLWFVSCAVLGATPEEIGLVMGKRRIRYLANMIRSGSLGLSGVLSRFTGGDVALQAAQKEQEQAKQKAPGGTV